MLAHREQSILQQHDKDPQHNDKNVHGLFGVFVCIFDSMLKIFITLSNRELSICDSVRKILNLMTKICMIFFDVFMYFVGIEAENRRGCGPHKSCCNVVHTKESYVEAVRIIQPEPSFTLQKVPNFVGFNQNRMFLDYIIQNPCVIRIIKFGLHQNLLAGGLHNT